MSTDDPRIKRVLKRYLKGEEFSDACLALTGVSFDELQTFCRCDADKFTRPPALDGYAMVCLNERLGFNYVANMRLDASVYDYFIHSYLKREFANSRNGIRLPNEDGPPEKIPRPEGTRWVSVRPKDGKETYVVVEDEKTQLTKNT